MRFFTVSLIALLAIAAATVSFLLGNPERLRGPLEAYFSERTGLPVRITGDLDWQLLPPLKLRLTQLEAGSPDSKRRGSLAHVSLSISPWSVLRAPSEPSLWTMRAFTLLDLQYVDGNRLYGVKDFQISDLKDRTAAPFGASLFYDDGQTKAEGAQATTIETLNLQGSMLIATSSFSMTMSDVMLTGSLAQGMCDAKLSLMPTTDDKERGSDASDLVPVADLQETRWQTDCVFDSLSWRGEDFTDVTWFSTNDTGVTRHRLTIADFFDGNAQFDLGIDASQRRVRWEINPTLTGVNGANLLKWVDRRSRWHGPINIDGEVSFTGNSAAAFLFTAKGELNLSSDTGMFDISDVKTQVQGLGAIMGSAANVDSWPNELNYQNFSAHWVMQGAEHQIAALIDNLKMSAAGNYQILADEMDVAAELTFVSNAEPKTLPVSKLLEDIPIPMRCQGSLSAPSCQIDADSGRDLVSDILSGKRQLEGETSLRDKIEDVIEEEVPEQYRNAARQLLDLLGESLRGNSEPK